LIADGKLEIDMSNSDDAPRKFTPPPSQEEIDEELKWRAYHLRKRQEQAKKELWTFPNFNPYRN
jgi:hypothetical protein